ncbi:hypothetical protein QUF72_05370 [Desulfobacterales bacterium HSG2]|nr:hypothetical protein [Desulfobacterales bacterium HSG2]
MAASPKTYGISTSALIFKNIDFDARDYYDIPNPVIENELCSGRSAEIGAV